MMRKMTFIKNAARFSAKLTTVAPLTVSGRVPLTKMAIRGFSEAAKEGTSLLKGHGSKAIHEIPAYQIEWVGGEILSCWNMEMFDTVITRYLIEEDAMTDQQFFLCLQRMAKFHMVPDEIFMSKILPVVKEMFQLVNADRVTAFTEAINYLATINVQDEELWELVEKKLVGERLHRYLAVDQLIQNTIALHRAGRVESGFFEIAEKYMIKHRRSLRPTGMPVITEIYKELGLGSDLFFQVLDNPTKPLAVIDV